jgi:CRISPR-associated protein Cmr4
MKGVLRDAYREMVTPHYADVTGQDDRSPRQRANEEDPELVTLFGPGKVAENDVTHAGALTITDARILAYPVRSLSGVFAWVTCPAVLSRFFRDLNLVEINQVPDLRQKPKSGEALVPDGSSLIVEDRIVLEEFDFRVAGRCEEIGSWLAEHAFLESDTFTPERMAKHLVVVHDDDFTHFVQHATEVVARIALDYDRKTVKQGALFYQEFLPPETVMYSVVLAYSARNGKEHDTASDNLEKLRECVRQLRYLQIGGDETTGKGLCAVRLL